MMVHIYNTLGKVLPGLIISLLITGVFVFQARAEMSQDIKVVFLPFNVQGAGEFAYLQDGAGSMLASRVTARAEVRVANKSEAVEALAQAWTAGKEQLFDQSLRALTAQYVIAGTLLSREDGLRIAVYLFDLGTGKGSQFAVKTVDAGGILSAIDTLSWDISEKAFGKQRPVIKTKGTPEKKKQASRFQTPHPDRAFKSAVISGFTQKTTGLESADFSAVSAGSRKLDMEINGLIVGDINNDGTKEIVVVSDSRLFVLQTDNNLIEIIDSLDIPGNLNVCALYLADLNNNGFSEIYISSSVGDTPSSLVLEWQGKGQFSFLLKKVPYYLRPVKMADGEVVLAGQKDSVSQKESTRALLGSPVYHLISNAKDGVRVQAKLQLPDSANIFNFVIVDLDNDGLAETVLVDLENRLMVYGNNGALLWASEQEYGFSKKYLGVPLVELDGAIDRETLYVAPKILARDVNGDGRLDIILGKNKLSSPKYFQNLRFFDGGTVEALTWIDNEMTVLWQTMKINSYLADYDFVSVSTAAGEGKVVVEQRTVNIRENNNHAGDLYVAGHLEESQFSFLLPFENKSKIQVFQITGKDRGNKKVQKIKPE